MAYTPEQRTNIRRLKRTARKKGASPREAKALLEAAGVESNYRHLPYGDRDSQGILQQRPSQGWGSGESVETDAAQFLAAAARVNRAGFKGSAGQLAQAVQRSAYPGRYDERSSEADRLLGKFSPSLKKDGSPRKGSTGYSYSPGVDNSGTRRALMLGYLSERGRPGSLLALKQGLDSAADVPGKVTYGAAPQDGGRRPARGSQTPRTDDEAVIGLAQLGHSYGLRTSSGKRDRQMTASGNVSDHAKGHEDRNARDLAGTPEQMDEAAVAIARELGIKGYRRGQPLVATVKRGRLRYQVLYRTNVGGDHYDHIHVGARKT